LCFEKKAALEAVKFLKFDSKIVAKVKDALEHIEPMNFLATKFELKQFIASIGPERYKYLEDVSKAQRIVYDLHVNKILSRFYLLEEIKDKGEPIFIEDLKIDANDIIENKIVEDEKVDELLHMLLDLTHNDPRQNTKKALLNHARKYANNKFKAAFRKVKWMR
jgi:hypothetical protein